VRPLRAATPAQLLLAVLTAWVAGCELSAALPSHPGTHGVFGDWPTEVVQLIAAGVCVAAVRGRSAAVRAGWALIAAGIVVWTLGDVYWLVVLDGADAPPIPSPADVAYLLFCPLVFAGLVRLLRAGTKGVPRSLVVDALIVGLAGATVGAAFVVPPVAAGASGGVASVATNIAYPITDLVLLSVILAAITLRGGRIDRTWALLGGGTLCFLVADSLYLVQSAHGTYSEPNLYGVGWAGSAVLYGWAAALPPVPGRRRAAVAGTEPAGIAMPLVLACLATLVTELQAGLGRPQAATLVLGTACILAVVLRLWLAFRENVAMVRASRVEALTDVLTGIGNRRALMADINAQAADATAAAPLVLALFDLDGFKGYNDTFGHPAGDALLARVGDRFRRALDGHGTAYRMGGDEFCALLAPGAGAADPQAVLAAAAAALGARGEGFAIGCSYGVVELPCEAADAEGALRLVDQRMYAAKHSGRISAGRQSKEVLLRAMCERDADLATHLVDVAALAEAIAERLGLEPARAAEVRDAAALHDIGKVAIPDAILGKPGPLDAAERVFIEEHTLIGERILAGAPALQAAARLVRSSHERYDGGGYPDGLAGEDIPLGARIIAVCDAFDAMVTDRSYRRALGHDEALAELRACAGTQFDPVIVEAFCAQLRDAAARRARIAA
jgi:diguanylate cyclase (GGDEF)-like protein/putative nucleotidyltransferase with HDIG domain